MGALDRAYRDEHSVDVIRQFVDADAAGVRRLHYYYTLRSLTDNGTFFTRGAGSRKRVGDEAARRILEVPSEVGQQPLEQYLGSFRVDPNDNSLKLR